MKENVRKEVEELIKIKNINCTVDSFRYHANWYDISYCHFLSDDFIREFRDKVDWNYISIHQKLGESFIREFKDNVVWCYISKYQKLSENFIREFKDKVNWENLPEEQHCLKQKWENEEKESKKQREEQLLKEIAKNITVTSGLEL